MFLYLSSILQYRTCALGRYGLFALDPPPIGWNYGGSVVGSRELSFRALYALQGDELDFRVVLPAEQVMNVSVSIELVRERLATHVVRLSDTEE